MKSSETSILVIAGYEGSGPVHWQSRLISKLSAAQLVEQDDWLFGSLENAVSAIVRAVVVAQKPVVFVAHSAGCLLVAHAIAALGDDLQKVKGAFMVSAPDPEIVKTLPKIDPALPLVPRQVLPFPSLLVSSSNDEFCSQSVSKQLAADWGSVWVDAGEAGHINTNSGHGPWPEGMMRFAGFLSKL
jgi:predicted alpha/beta hydrolase family esterase